MNTDLNEIFRIFRLADALDLAVVTLLFALVFHWMRKRSNQAFLLVLIGLASLYLLSNWLRMYLTLGLFRMGLWLSVIGILIIFQNDLRSGFERLAAWHPFSRRPTAPPHTAWIGSLVEATALFAREKIGALIVLPSRQNLDRHLHGGERLDGRVSVPLLHSIFHSKSPGHDGAVVMRGNLVERFGVHLPLSTNFTLLGPGGTRHAAALGLAEQSDALVIVVSEERGSVSLARNGQLQTMDDPQELAGRLEAFSREGTQQQRPSRWVRRFAGPLLTFSAAFVAAVFFWLMFAFQVETVQRVVDQVPVESHQLPQDWVIESMTPQQVRVNVTGSQRAFAAYNWSTLRVALDLSQPSEGVQTVAVGEESMQLPVEISLVQAEPSVVRVTAYKTRTVRLPVEVKTHGELPKEWELVSQTPSLKSVDVKVRESLLPRIKAVPTKSIDLADVASTRTQEVSLVLPEGVWPSEDMPSKVQVAFQLRRIEAAPMK